MNAHLGTACLGWDGSTLTQHVQMAMRTLEKLHTGDRKHAQR